MAVAVLFADRGVAVDTCRWQSRKNGEILESPKVDGVSVRDVKVFEFFEELWHG